MVRENDGRTVPAPVVQPVVTVLLQEKDWSYFWREIINPIPRILPDGYLRFGSLCTDSGGERYLDVK